MQNIILINGFPHSSAGKESACNVGDMGSVPIRKIPWRRAWQPTAVFLPGESHGQRSLAGYSPWGRTESDTTEVTSLVCASVSSSEHGNNGAHRVGQLQRGTRRAGGSVQHTPGSRHVINTAVPSLSLWASSFILCPPSLSSRPAVFGTSYS